MANHCRLLSTFRYHYVSEPRTGIRKSLSLSPRLSSTDIELHLRGSVQGELDRRPFGYGAPHSSARGTSTLLNNMLLSTHSFLVRLFHSLVGSRTGAMLRRFSLSVAPRFLWECLNSQTVSSVPVPASSNPSCRFPAMGLPACFLSRVM